MKKILIIDDEKRMCRVLQLVFEARQYQVATAHNGTEGMAAWDDFQPDLVLSDLKMPGADGMEVLKFGNLRYPGVPIIILTAFGTIPAAVEAIKLGAFDYITKPVDNDLILKKTKAALEKAAKSAAPPQKPHLIGSSRAMEDIRQELALVAKTSTSVLITGESGTGKELAASTIHDLFAREKAPIIRVNCAAIPRDLMESELFGHKKGAFTGAVMDRAGAFVLARGGLLFLDEIGDLPLELQPKLLHAVEDKVVTPVGADTPTRVDVKIVSATNQDLMEMARNGRFRADLLYRLNIYTIHMPPLRSRPEDIPELATHFLQRLSLEFRSEKIELDPDALPLLAAYAWPGNVRELKNILERLSLNSRGRTISRKTVADMLSKFDREWDPVEQSRKKNLHEQERQIILEALEACGWNQSKTATYLGITRNTLRYRQKKFNITPE